jgi:hypothetical protein
MELPQVTTHKEEFSLGPLVSNHPVPSVYFWWGAALVGGVALLGLFWVFQGLTHFGEQFAPPEKGGKDSAYNMVLGLGALLLIGDFLLISWVSIRFNNRVMVYRDGFVSFTFFRHEVFPWADIEAIDERNKTFRFNFAPVANIQIFTVRRRDGKMVELTSILSKGSELGKEVFARTYDVQFPGLWEKVKRGEDVVFGPVSLSRAGFQCFRKVLPWDQLKELGVKTDLIQVIQIDGRVWAQIDLKSLKNLQLFLGIIEKLKQS